MIERTSEREKSKIRLYRNESDLDENSFGGSLLSICFLATLHYHAVESEPVYLKASCSSLRQILPSQILTGIAANWTPLLHVPLLAR